MATGYDPEVDGSAIKLALISIELHRAFGRTDAEICAIIDRDFPGLLHAAYLLYVADGLVAYFTARRENPRWRLPQRRGGRHDTTTAR